MGEQMPSKNEKTQDDMQSEIISELKKIFGDVDKNKLAIIMNNGSRESDILKTAIQHNRPINLVKIITENQEIIVDDGDKKQKNVVIPEGALEIVYGQSEEDVADLIIYIWRDENGKVQREIVAQNIDSEKAMGKTMESMNYSPGEGERKPYGDIPEIDGTGRHIRSRRMSDGDHPNK